MPSQRRACQVYSFREFRACLALRMASQTAERSYIHLLHGALTPTIGTLTVVVIILSIILWRRSRPLKSAKRAVNAEKSASSPNASPVPGQKSLAERLRELDERDERHKQATMAEIQKYERFEYDPTACASLEHFLPVKRQTHCIFSPSSKVSPLLQRVLTCDRSGDHMTTRQLSVLRRTSNARSLHFCVS